MTLALSETRFEPPPAYDAEHIRTLRTNLGFSQPYFSKILNVSPKTMQSWEQGTRTPNGASARLLQLIEHPHLLDTLLQMKYATRHNKDWMPFASPVGFIRLILLVDFDPLKIFGEPGAIDEYDTYAVKVYDLLQSEADVGDIAAYLSRLHSDFNSRVIEPERLMQIAEKIWRMYHEH